MIAQVAEFAAAAGYWLIVGVLVCAAVSVLFAGWLVWLNWRAHRHYQRERDEARDRLRAQRDRYDEHQAKIFQFPVGSPVTGSFRIGEKR